MESANLRYRPHIDGLRGVAVIVVICFHAFPALFRGGLVGVDVFFVISGFLISSILYADFRAPASKLGSVIANFYARRVRRIFPALVVVLVSTYLLGLVLLIPREFEKLSLDMVASAGFCMNFLLSSREGYFDPSSNANPLLHLWSLSVEEQFYLFWPLVIWLAIRCRVRIMPVAIFLAALSYFWNAQRYAGTEIASFYLPQMRLWELMIGALAAAVFPLIPGNLAATSEAEIDNAHGAAWNNLASLLGLALIGAGIAFARDDFNLPDGHTLLPTAGAALVVCSAGSAWSNRVILSNRALVLIGVISYPLYLWHWPLLSFAQIASDGPLSPLARVTIVCASVVLAWLTYVLVERPVRNGRRARKMVKPLVVAMAAVAGCAYITERARGFPSRFPRLINEISTFNYDPTTAIRQGTYFLMGDQDETNFKRDPNEIQKGKPTLYLWGDSHAAALYPGLSRVYGAKFNIVQRTTAKTPPFMAQYFNPGDARQINEYVFDSIVRDRPDYVFLDANWQGYEWRDVETTIVALKAAGIQHIVVVGPVPQWFGSLPQQLFNYVRRHRADPVPISMTQGADPEPTRLDGLMASILNLRRPRDRVLLALQDPSELRRLSGPYW
jgi:peptidoglycan/LPS O-acetylase OafA/YrhL